MTSSIETQKATQKKTTRRTQKTQKTKTKKPMAFVYELPAVRGIQSNHEYYMAMIPVRLLSKIFKLDMNEETPPMERDQRLPNKGRISKIKDYILKGYRARSIERKHKKLQAQPDFDPESFYIFNAATAFIDGESDFVVTEEGGDHGKLILSMDTKLLVSDGQHRINGLIEALKEEKYLGDESLPVVLFLNLGKRRRQQAFHDINFNIVKPSKSLNLLFDYEKDESQVAKMVVSSTKPFLGKYTDFDRTSLAKRSLRVFTFNAVSEAINKWLNGGEAQKLSQEIRVKRGVEMFNALYDVIPHWKALDTHRIFAGEVRSKSIACHAITLCALAEVCNQLMQEHGEDWKAELQSLNFHNVNWDILNPQWTDLIRFGGRINKNATTVRNFANWLLERKKK